jgi:hypothetical protein
MLSKACASTNRWFVNRLAMSCCLWGHTSGVGRTGWRTGHLTLQKSVTLCCLNGSFIRHGRTIHQHTVSIRNPISWLLSLPRSIAWLWNLARVLLWCCPLCHVAKAISFLFMCWWSNNIGMHMHGWLLLVHQLCSRLEIDWYISLKKLKYFLQT